MGEPAAKDFARNISLVSRRGLQHDHRRPQSFPRKTGVIVEGFRPLPRLVQPLLALRAHAVWLLPTSTFRHAVIESRGGSAWGFLAKTTDPEKAFENLLERDRMFTEILRKETVRLGLNAIEVDDTITEDDLVTRVATLFGL